MVFEQFIKERWIERKPRHAFMLGVFYSIIGLVSARLIFPSSLGLMALAFTSLLLVPSLNTLLRHEENVEIREKKLSLRLLFRDHKDIFEIYLFLFLGIFLVYSIMPLVLGPEQTLRFFPSHLNVAGISGMSYAADTFISILTNNLVVMLACLLLSLVYGAGSILFITWNASVWGIIFGYMAKQAALQSGQNPLPFFIMTILPVLPHTITEATSYFSAAIVGGVVSKAVIREKLNSKKFNHVLTDALLLLGLAVVLVIVAAIIETAYITLS
jgi:uncharacterized membrane protein SpoIIM required for sporulation